MQCCSGSERGSGEIDGFIEAGRVQDAQEIVGCLLEAIVLGFWSAPVMRRVRVGRR